VAVVWADHRLQLGTGDGAWAQVRELDHEARPRWVVWSNETALALLPHGVRLTACWDLAAVHRLLSGSWAGDAGRVWAAACGLPPDGLPRVAPHDLFHQAADDDAGEGATDGAGYLRAEWVESEWRRDLAALTTWGELALEAGARQQRQLEALADRPHATATARSESAAELLCAELTTHGLPVNRAAAEALMAEHVGPRPRTEREAAALRAQRDQLVLRHAPSGMSYDLRSPAQVRSLLMACGVDLPDTRAWRLEGVRDAHAVVPALLQWRKSERIATTYGYSWLDEHVGADGRLRGSWTGSDGAAGRMTASAGLHNLPAEMRRAVIAEPGRLFVRADLGQIEPRVLAAVSGDRALARATQQQDLYAPVAHDLGIDRPTAKVAVLGAMYGQTTGHGAVALRNLKAAYPVAMAYLDEADRAGQLGRDVRTYGGRRVRMGWTNGPELSERQGRSEAAARGRYARNAMIQGAAAELFKAWAATVRARALPFDARIVLCLHDELLVDAPEDAAPAVAEVVEECLQEAAYRWAPRDCGVRFVADISVITCWADAK
jgi:DNA polymerase-1